MSTVCKNCGQELPENVKFCTNCGKPVVREPICPACGEKVKPGAKFCSECGAPISSTPMQKADTARVDPTPTVPSAPKGSVEPGKNSEGAREEALAFNGESRTDNQDNASSGKTGKVIGLVIGGLAVILLILVIAYQSLGSNTGKPTDGAAVSSTDSAGQTEKSTLTLEEFLKTEDGEHWCNRFGVEMDRDLEGSFSTITANGNTLDIEVLMYQVSSSDAPEGELEEMKNEIADEMSTWGENGIPSNITLGQFAAELEELLPGVDVTCHFSVILVDDYKLCDSTFPFKADS